MLKKYQKSHWAIWKILHQMWKGNGTCFYFDLNYHRCVSRFWNVFRFCTSRIVKTNIFWFAASLDMIAIPDFAAGAMENWGLITYRTSALLWSPKHSAESNKQRVSAVVSHELAHQVVLYAQHYTFHHVNCTSIGNAQHYSLLWSCQLYFYQYSKNWLYLSSFQLYFYWFVF